VTPHDVCRHRIVADLLRRGDLRVDPLIDINCYFCEAVICYFSYVHLFVYVASILMIDYTFTFFSQLFFEPSQFHVIYTA